ncbi:MAG: cysteine-rich CWC family protein [Halioglobus sp.]
MKTDLGFSESNCPLCGEQNLCAMSAGQELSDCWCKNVEFNPDTLLAVPAKMQGKVCICKACAMQRDTTS